MVGVVQRDGCKEGGVPGTVARGINYGRARKAHGGVVLNSPVEARFRVASGRKPGQAAGQRLGQGAGACRLTPDVSTSCPTPGVVLGRVDPRTATPVLLRGLWLGQAGGAGVGCDPRGSSPRPPPQFLPSLASPPEAGGLWVP